MLREAYDQASNYLQYFAQDNRPMSPENVRPFLLLVLFCFVSQFLLLFFSPQFLYSSNFECSFSYFFLICS